MTEVVFNAGGGSNKIAKVRMKGVVEERYEYVGAQTGQRAACGACPINDIGSSCS